MVASLRLVPASSFARTSAPTAWLWPGVVAPGSVTLLTGSGKQAGKTTLLAVLLAKLGAGGTLAGRPVSTARAVVLSEEAEELWTERHGRLHFADSVRFACQPFAGRPTLAEWTGLIRELLAEEGGPGLLVVDPLAMFLPGAAEGYAPAMIDALAPLRLLTARGWAVLLLHHPVKGRNGRDLTERGSGALTGFVDVVGKLYRDDDAMSRRVRRLECRSRPFGFETEVRIELAADGTDYAVVPEDPDFLTYEEGLPILKAMLQDADRPLSRKELWDGWLEDFDRPSLATLRRWLWRAQAEGAVEHRGSGRRNDPFRYRLAGQAFPLGGRDPFDVLNEAMRGMRAGKPDEAEGDEE